MDQQPKNRHTYAIDAVSPEHRFSNAPGEFDRRFRWRGWVQEIGVHTDEIEGIFLRHRAGPYIFDSIVQCGRVVSYLSFYGMYPTFVIKWIEYYPVVLEISWGWPGNILCFAVLGYNESVVEKIIDLGANVNLKNRTSSICALYVAVEHHRTGMVRLLLIKGANPNVVNENGVTLFAFVADRFARRNHMRDPLISMYQHFPEYTQLDLKDVDIMRLLISHGAHVGQVQPHSFFSRRPITAIDILRAPRVYPTRLLAKLLNHIFEAWEAGPHPSQKWRRRQPFLQVLAEHMIRPLQYREEALQATAVPPSEAVPRLQGHRLDLLRIKAFCELSIVKRIASFL